MSVGKDIFRGVPPIRTQWAKTSFNMFFNPGGIAAMALDEKEFRVLDQTGRYVRGAIRRTIRPGPKRHKPLRIAGRPPKYYTRGFASLKDGIFYQADIKDKGPSSVVIGPNKINTKVRPITKASGAQLLEEGGMAEGWFFRAEGRRDKGGLTPGENKRAVALYKPYPFVNTPEIRGVAEDRMIKAIQGTFGV